MEVIWPVTTLSAIRNGSSSACLIRQCPATQLLGTVLAPLFGLETRMMVIFLGVLITIYPMLGGTEGVIWAGVVQSVVLILGVIVCVYYVIAGVPGGVSAIIETGKSVTEQEPLGKFSLGSFEFTVFAASFDADASFVHAGVRCHEHRVRRVFTAASDCTGYMVHLGRDRQWRHLGPVPSGGSLPADNQSSCGCQRCSRCGHDTLDDDHSARCLEGHLLDFPVATGSCCDSTSSKSV